MKILIIANKLPYPPKDGGAIATLSLAESLAKFAHIDLLAINTSKHYFDLEKIPTELKQKINFYDFFLNTDLKSTELLKNLLFSNKPYNAERFINQEFAEKIETLIQQNEYSVVQFEGLYTLPYIENVRKYSSVKISYRAHNIEHEIWERTLAQTSNVIKKYYIDNLTKRLKKFEQSFINKYDILIPITERDNEKLNKIGNKKPSITIPTGIDINNYKIENSNPEENSIFHIGALDWSPNQEGLMWFINNCWNIILQKNPQIKFYIAGRNASKSFVEKLKGKNIFYLGEVDDAHEFINSKSVMIVPLLSGSGMRIKIIEGMALAKAIVTTSIGVEGISATNNKELFIADKPEEFSTKILELISKPKLTFETGKNARVFVSNKFDNFALAKRLYSFYNLEINN